MKKQARQERTFEALILLVYWALGLATLFFGLGFAMGYLYGSE